MSCHSCPTDTCIPPCRLGCCLQGGYDNTCLTRWQESSSRKRRVLHGPVKWSSARMAMHRRAWVCCLAPVLCPRLPATELPKRRTACCLVLTPRESAALCPRLPATEAQTMTLRHVSVHCLLTARGFAGTPVALSSAAACAG